MTLSNLFSVDKIIRISMIDGNGTLLTLRTFNASKKTSFSSNINFCYVFYSALTFFSFFLASMVVGKVAECCFHSHNFYLSIETRLNLSTDNITPIY